jgi:hypothetical protein
MALISQRTILKSLRYGKDRVGGGDSNQPYIKSPIPDNSKSLDRTGGVDFLLRGGTLAPTRSAQDASRLTKMFFDFKSPNGVLFTAKQNLLSRTGVKTQASGFINEGAYLPTSTILQAAGNAFGTHLYKQGVNPLEGIQKYSQTIKFDQNKDENRLVQLKNSKIASQIQTSTPGLFGFQSFRDILSQINPLTNKLSSIAKTIFTPNHQKTGISLSNNEILRYGGGPGSLLGVGQTAIKRYYFSTTNGFSNNPTGGYFNVLGAGKGIEDRYIGNNGTQFITDFRKKLFIDKTAQRQNILSNSPDYTRKNIEQRVNLGNPGRRDKNVSSYTKGLIVNGKNAGALDKITAYPIYKSKFPDPLTKSNGGISSTNDLVQFRIGIIDNNTPNEKVYIHFRAFIDAMDDNYTATWDSFKYMGRGENFYRYNGFTRTVNLGWTVAAQSKEELIPMYKKLNYLASSLAPDYSAGGYMRGNLATLTVGGYLYEQPGIITSINYSVPTESPWEIGINDAGGIDTTVKELPHIIRVTGFQFIPIHRFVPRLQQNKYGDGISENNTGEIIKPDVTYGKEKYISLSKEGIIDNYTPELIGGNVQPLPTTVDSIL